MSGVYTKLSYRQLQTLKHAMIHYMQREGISDSDLQSEEVLLKKILENVDIIKDKIK